MMVVGLYDGNIAIYNLQVKLPGHGDDDDNSDDGGRINQCTAVMVMMTISDLNVKPIFAVDADENSDDGGVVIANAMRFSEAGQPK